MTNVITISQKCFQCGSIVEVKIDKEDYESFKDEHENYICNKCIEIGED